MATAKLPEIAPPVIRKSLNLYRRSLKWLRGAVGLNALLSMDSARVLARRTEFAKMGRKVETAVLSEENIPTLVGLKPFSLSTAITVLVSVSTVGMNLKAVIVMKAKL